MRLYNTAIYFNNFADELELIQKRDRAESHDRSNIRRITIGLVEAACTFDKGRRGDCIAGVNIYFKDAAVNSTNNGGGGGGQAA